MAIKAIPPLRLLAIPFLGISIGVIAITLFISRQAHAPGEVGIEHPLAPKQAAAVDAAVEAEMTKQQAVGLAIGIIRQGHIVYLKCYGYADRERSLPVTFDTMFRWASCSKSLTAVAAMQLRQTGALDLNADIHKYIPEFPDKKYPITVRGLLCHQSGIGGYESMLKTPPFYNEPHPFTDPIKTLDLFKDAPLLTPPGTKYIYSALGYILLSAVIQRAGHAPYADQIAQRIARPLGLTTLQLDHQWVYIPHRAVGYFLQDGLVFRSTDTDQSWKIGASGFISDIGDFAKFAEALLQGTLVNKESEKLMWTLQHTKDGKPTTYGYGFELVVDAAGKPLSVSHFGVQEKTRTRFIIFPQENNGIVIMTNSEWVDPQTFTNLIAATLGPH